MQYLSESYSETTYDGMNKDAEGYICCLFDYLLIVKLSLCLTN
jgi:hypothetical protein